MLVEQFLSLTNALPGREEHAAIGKAMERLQEANESTQALSGDSREYRGH